jgi:hypothetical protein
MKGDCKLVTPPSPLFLKSGDFRGFTGAVSCLESIGLELIDSKGVSRGAWRGVRNGNRTGNIPNSNT